MSKVHEYRLKVLDAMEIIHEYSLVSGDDGTGKLGLNKIGHVWIDEAFTVARAAAAYVSALDLQVASKDKETAREAAKAVIKKHIGDPDVIEVPQAVWIGECVIQRRNGEYEKPKSQFLLPEILEWS